MARNDSLGLAKQVAEGTGVAVMEYFPPVESVDVSQNLETIEIDETTGTRFPTRLEYGTEFWGLDASGAARVASLPRLLSAFFGAPTTTTPDGALAPTARQHLFDPAAAGKTPIYHSALVTRTDPDPPIVDLMTDVLGNELTLSVEPNGLLMFEASLIGRTRASAAEPSPTFDFSRRFPFHEAKAYLSIDGGVEAEVKVGAWSFTYNNNLDTDAWVLGQRGLYTLQPGNADAEASFSPREALSAHYARALASTPEEVKLRLTATGPIIGGAVAYQIEVIAYLLEYTDVPANLSAADRLNMVEISARAAYDDVTSKFVTVSVINTVASY
jgi:hypothetical protein